MSTKIIPNLQKRIRELKLTKKQRKILSEYLDLLMVKYDQIADNPKVRPASANYFEGVAEGFNNAFKLIHGIDDDYNSNR